MLPIKEVLVELERLPQLLGRVLLVLGEVAEVARLGLLEHLEVAEEEEVVLRLAQEGMEQ